MPVYDVEALSRTAISDAFPIVHLVMPKLDLQAWQRFAQSSLHTSRDRPAGILIARRRARRHISGLVCYRLEADLTCGRIIQAGNLIGIDILDPRPIILLLIRHLGRLAQLNGCTAVHIRIPDGDSAATFLLGLLDEEGVHRRVRCLQDVELLLKDLLPSEETRID